MMPMDYSRYPQNWRDISKHIRYERAGNKCEWCGIPNRELITRRLSNPYQWQIVSEEGAWMQDEDWSGPYVTVTLTVAHLGIDYPDGRKGNPHDKMDVRDDNLAALCNRCHLVHDLEEHKVNAKETRLRKKHAAIVANGQKSLFEAQS